MQNVHKKNPAIIYLSDAMRIRGAFVNFPVMERLILHYSRPQEYVSQLHDNVMQNAYAFECLI